MKKIIVAIIGLLIIATALFSFSRENKTTVIEAVTENEAQQNNVAVQSKTILENAHAFATAANAKTGAVFVKINNPTNTPKSLIDVRSDVAEFVELHQNVIDPDDGQMMMRKVRNIDINPNNHVMLEPTGYHVMLIKLKKQLIKDEKFSVTFVFENGEEITQQILVTAPGTTPDAHQQAHENNEDHDHPEIERLDFSDTYLNVEQHDKNPHH